MKKQLFIFFILCVVACSSFGSEKKVNQKEQDFGFTRFISYNPSIPADITEDISPNTLAANRQSIGFIVGGVSLLVLGTGGWISGTLMVYFSALGLGWITSDRIKVRFLNGNTAWGYLGIAFGYTLIGMGATLCIVGAIMLVYGILTLTKSRAKLFIEPGDKPRTASIGLSFALPAKG